MNILMLTASGAGGVTTHIKTLGLELERLGHKVVVGLEKREWNDELTQHFPAVLMNFHAKTPKEVVQTLRKLKHVISEYDIDIVHGHYRTNGLYMRMLRPFVHVDYIWTNHLVPIPCDFVHRALTYYGKKAIAIGIDSHDFMRNQMKIPEEKIEIVRHGIDLTPFQNQNIDTGKMRERYGISTGEKVILLLGRLAEVKGHAFLLNALQGMQGVKILFTGDGGATYKNEVMQQIKRLNMEHQVVFTGKVKANEILSIADVMVLPSKQEGYPLVVLESFASNVPVVRTKTGGYSDTKDLCLGVDYGDEPSLRACIVKALSNDSEIQDMVKRAYEKVCKDWNVTAMAQNLLRVYEKQ